MTIRTSLAELRFDVHDLGTGLGHCSVTEALSRGWSTKPPHGIHRRGLGLALVNQVAARYGGAITVERDPHTRFEVVIPFPRPTEQ